tara:strand:+ start:6881 stop:7483 length:603 start_codon:yes stop_codon:yes gene_type:complete
MNIFLFHVKLLFDTHIVKMPLETAQLLYSVWWVHTSGAGLGPGAYKCTHKNHPSAVWARSAPTHYLWLCKYGLALCKEYTFRYKRVHKCQQHIENLRALGFPPATHLHVQTPPPSVKKFARRGCPKGIHWFALAMPDKYLSSSAEKAYAQYYMSKAYGTTEEKMKRKASNKRLELERLESPGLEYKYKKYKRKYKRKYKA